jgi:hypothetical protein
LIQTTLMALELSLILQSAQKIHNPSRQVRNEAAAALRKLSINILLNIFFAGARSSSMQRLSSSRSQSSARNGQALRALARSLDVADEISSDDEPSPNVSPRYVPLKSKLTPQTSTNDISSTFCRRPFPKSPSSPERRVSQDALRSRLDRITHLKKQLGRAKRL